MRMQLGKPKELREKIFGGDPNYSSLVKKNMSPFGIPQGAPISDLLANFYMFDFDQALGSLAKELDGYYMRYSDDILFIFPNNKMILEGVLNFIHTQIKMAGEKLVIKDEKTIITEFYLSEDIVKFRPHKNKGKNSMKRMEYLGFSFDGENIYIKDSTLSSYYRKMTYAIRSQAEYLVKRYSDKAQDEIVERGFSRLCQEFGKIQMQDIEPSTREDEGKQHNFWTYAHRAQVIMGEMGYPILKQLRNRNKKLRSLLNSEITTLLKKN